MRVRQGKAQDDYESRESQPHRHSISCATTPDCSKLAEVIDAQLASALDKSGDAAVRWLHFVRVLVWQMWHLLTGRARRAQT